MFLGNVVISLCCSYGEGTVASDDLWENMHEFVLLCLSGFNLIVKLSVTEACLGSKPVIS